jgi:1,4-dihydroxy-2-naphthoyl-CoA hydrolase
MRSAAEHVEAAGRPLGLSVVEAGEERVVARLEVEDRHRQPVGLVHGGVYATMAEAMCAGATAAAVAGDGSLAQGHSSQTSFLRPIFAGGVHAEARRRHRGRTTWVWEVDVSDDEGRACALVRMTVSVRPGPGA